MLSWKPFGSLLDVFEALWGPLDGSWEALVRLPGGSWEPLGRLLEALGSPWSILGVSLSPSWLRNASGIDLLRASPFWKAKSIKDRSINNRSCFGIDF